MTYRYIRLCTVTSESGNEKASGKKCMTSYARACEEKITDILLQLLQNHTNFGTRFTPNFGRRMTPTSAPNSQVTSAGHSHPTSAPFYTAFSKAIRGRNAKDGSQDPRSQDADGKIQRDHSTA